MKKWFIHILLLAGLFGMLTTSCCQDEAIEQTGTTNGTVRIQFTLAMDGNAGSRVANWSDITGDDETDEEDIRKVGSTYENTINHFQVFLFQNTRCLGEVGNLSLVNVSGGPKNKYTFRGEVTVSNATITNNKLQNATIMVVANYEGYVNGNLAVTQNYIFDYIASAYNASVSNKKYIPMWGMLRPASGILLNESTDDTFTPIGDIYMLRSLAKIEVLMAANDFTLEGAKLNKYNTKAKLLPSKPTNGYFSATSTSDYDTENCMNDEVSAVTSELSFFETSTGSYVIYVPEYNNDSKDIEITLDIAKDGISISGDLDSKGKFKLATSSIVRNHWYKCTVNSVDYNTGFDLTLAVAPWAENVDVLDYTENTVTYNINSTSPWSEFDAYDNTNPQVVLLKTGINVAPAKYMFTLLTPKNAEWRAVLEGEHIEFETGEGYSGELLGGENVSKQIIHGFTSSDNTGTVITLGVKADNSNMDGQFSARLRFYVNLGNKWYEIDLIDGNESTTNGGGLNHWTIKHLKSM